MSATPVACADEIFALEQARVEHYKEQSHLRFDALAFARLALNAAIDAKVQEATAPLVAQNAETLRTLETIQWGQVGGIGGHCPDCRQMRSQGHHPYCTVKVALRPLTQPTPEEGE